MVSAEVSCVFQKVTHKQDKRATHFAVETGGRVIFTDY